MSSASMIDRSAAARRALSVVAALWLIALLWVKLSHPAANGGTAEQPALTLIVLLCLLHSWIAYRAAATIAFAAIAAIVSLALEASSIATGFPFGFYVHNVAAPKLLGVPGVVPVTYAFLAYLSWSIACTLLRCHGTGRMRTFGAPMVAALVMPGYDLAIDPIGSTVGGAWTYLHPGGYFGVPLSNFLGWILTSWAICQAVALAFAMLRVEPRVEAASRSWRVLPCAVWAALALQYVVDLPHAPGGTVTVAGATFVIRHIFESGVVMALLAMLPPAVAAALVALSDGDGRSSVTTDFR